MSKLWVRNESTGLEREMSETSFKYHDSKRKNGANPLRPKFTFLHKVEEPKTEIQKEMDRLRAEKAAKEQEPAQIQPKQEPVLNQEPVKRSPGRPKETQV